MTIGEFLKIHRGEMIYLVLFNSSYSIIPYSGYSYFVPFCYLDRVITSSFAVPSTTIQVLTFEDERLG